MGKEMDFLGLEVNKDKLQGLGDTESSVYSTGRSTGIVLLFLFLRFGSVNRGIFQNLGGRERV